MSVLREIKRRVAASKAAFIEPCLPTLAQKPPAGPRWLHEIKHDGYRLQARRGCEGIVSKLKGSRYTSGNKGSRYTSGKTRDWIKIKNPNAPWAKRLEDEDWSPAARPSKRK